VGQFDGNSRSEGFPAKGDFIAGKPDIASVPDGSLRGSMDSPAGNRFCASRLDAVNLASAEIVSGQHDTAVGGGACTNGSARSKVL
jgi:acetyl-CoA acetyltransferase